MSALTRIVAPDESRLAVKTGFYRRQVALESTSTGYMNVGGVDAVYIIIIDFIISKRAVLATSNQRLFHPRHVKFQLIKIIEGIIYLPVRSHGVQISTKCI